MKTEPVKIFVEPEMLHMMLWELPLKTLRKIARTVDIPSKSLNKVELIIELCQHDSWCDGAEFSLYVKHGTPPA